MKRSIGPLARRELESRDTISPTAISETDVPTVKALLAYIGGNMTQGGVPYIATQARLFGKSNFELNNAGFQFIKSGVLDVASGFDGTKDNRLATCACIDAYLQSNYIALNSQTYQQLLADIVINKLALEELTVRVTNLETP